MHARRMGLRLRALVCAWLVAISALVGLAGPGKASVPDDTSEPPAVRLADRSFTVPTDAGAGRARYLWTWPAGRRGFVPFDMGSSAGVQLSYASLLSVDLDTGEQAGRLTFPPEQPAWGGGNNAYFSSGTPLMLAVDQSNGLVYVAYTQAGLLPRQVTALATMNGCLQQSGMAGCLGGFHVVDGRTMERVATVPLRFVRIDGGAVVALPRALRLEPATASAAAKLLVLYEEVVLERADTGADLRPRYRDMNATYLTQFDVDSLAQEWTVQVQACRGHREKMGGGQPLGAWRERAWPSTVFRSPEGAPAAIWIGCHADSRQTGLVVRLPLDGEGMPPGAVPLPAPPDFSDLRGPDEADRRRPPQNPVDQSSFRSVTQTYTGPDNVAEILADPASERILMRSMQAQGEVWIVFDGRRGDYMGAVGIGKFDVGEGSAAIDENTGRLYVWQGGNEGGLFIADIRRTPLPQALRFPEFGSLTGADLPMSVDDGGSTAPRRILIRTAIDRYQVIEDHLPVTQDPEGTAFEGRTLDIAEDPESTSVALDGAARGFGARTILIGGAEALLRGRSFDPVGNVRGGYAHAHNQVENWGLAIVPAPPKGVLPPPDPCLDQNREVVFGFVGPKGPAIVDGDGARGTAVPMAIDPTTASDAEAAASRCTTRDWDQIWTTALFGQPPAQEPGADVSSLTDPAECLSSDDPGASSDRRSDPVSSPFAAEVECESEESSGFGYVRAVGAPSLSIAEALSSFRIYRDPGRGVVARIESVARGIDIGGQLRIETVRGVAESWANGRRQPVPESEREPGYDPNCDFERSAGTCFQRHLMGVRMPGYSCGPCGDEAAFERGVQQIFGADAKVRMRKPDAALARGSANGFIAAVQKPDAERFGDLILNNDMLQTVVPALEIVRYAPSQRFNDLLERDAKRGRQIYQFAGVEVSSSYGIQCLLVYDAEKNTCSAAAELPGELKVQLTDPDGKPLAGGSFEVREDIDGDGVHGLADTLAGQGPCVTAEDGIGTCSFPALAPGKYVVSQVSAPPPYAPSTESFSVDLVSGESRTVVFTNVSGLSTVNVEVKTEDGKPLPGAAFAVYPDPDADGKVSPDAKPMANCDTGADGTCTMTVPTGSYLLVQTAAPNGLEPIEPLPFVIASGGQVASVQAVNYPPLAVPAPPPAASPGFTYQPPPAPIPPTLHTVPLPTMGIPQDDPQTAPADAGPGIRDTIERVVRAPGDALRLLARSPAEGVAFAAAALLFVLACLAVDRRRKMLSLTA